MKKVLLMGIMTLFIGLLTVGTLRAGENIPNMMGTWESQIIKNYEHSAEKGYKPSYERFLIVVEEQKDRLFFGHKEKFINKKMVEKEKFSGVIYWDNKTVYMVDYDKGYNHCTIESPTEIRGVYMEDGSKAMIVLLIWKKIK